MATQPLTECSNTPLFKLSPEIHSLILEHIQSPSDKIAFISTCRNFYNSMLYEDAFLRIIQDKARISAVYRLDKPLHLSSSTSGDRVVSAGRPFVFKRAWIDDGRLVVAATFPTYFRNSDAHVPGEIILNSHQLTVYQPEKDTDPGIELDWDEHFWGHIRKVSARFMRKRWACPLCVDRREICPGCGISRSWLSLFKYRCGWNMPCPCCVGHDIAEEATALYNEEDWEALYDFWVELSQRLKIEIPDMYDPSRGLKFPRVTGTKVEEAIVS